MKFENPEYLGLMVLHAAKWHLKKLLKRPYSAAAVRKLRPILPYSIITDGDKLPGTCNRSYNALGIPGPARYDFKWRTYPSFEFPRDKSRLWTKGEEQTWFFDDGNPPWRDRQSAEAYLQTLERFIDFSLEDLPNEQA